mmetsp:Transcript_64518/g.75688  ORF Transcript_64518/g.75688 Transcript_64518/m.75688 type:complete len:676 (-) Transcript_64518:51-2078(-)
MTTVLYTTSVAASRISSSTLRQHVKSVSKRSVVEFSSSFNHLVGSSPGSSNISSWSSNAVQRMSTFPLKAESPASTMVLPNQRRRSSNLASSKSSLPRLETSQRNKSTVSLTYDYYDETTEYQDDYVFDGSIVAENTATFPSIVIAPDGIVPQGSFAEAQAEYLDPDLEAVDALYDGLVESNIGIVAHYYMDVEIQSILQAVGRKSARMTYEKKSGDLNDTATLDQIENGDLNKLSDSIVSIADSLAMGDHAVRMVRDLGATSIVCLGVDFMAESVQAILDKNGYGHVPVYRATQRAIGCSLAESAESRSYRAWLQMAADSQKGPPLHVVYINTSLESKAMSSSIVPTITCTSSNVLRTILQASVQIPDVQIYYGPDTYMGENLVSLFDAILQSPETWSDERVRNDLHPEHNRETLRILRDNISVFPNGNCVVHHMFGGDVVKTVKEEYADAYVTAHLEVPGEMFQIAMEKSLEGKGAVGSTSNILEFISDKVKEVSAEEAINPSSAARRLQFVLGTEAGMVTSIVKAVKTILDATGQQVEAEIIFPVASEAMTATVGDDHLAVVPGVSGSEGCSTAGGCATCPFMKMNDLDALTDLITMVNDAQETRNIENHANFSQVSLNGHLPPQRLKGKMLNGRNAIELGVLPIMHMRHFMAKQELPDELVQSVHAANRSS